MPAEKKKRNIKRTIPCPTCDRMFGTQAMLKGHSIHCKGKSAASGGAAADGEGAAGKTPAATRATSKGVTPPHPNRPRTDLGLLGDLLG